MAELRDLLHDYLAARGMAMPVDADSARHVAEEAIELVEVVARDGRRTPAVEHEVADVVLAATVIAEQYGFSVEDAIRAKTAHDSGRGA